MSITILDVAEARRVQAGEDGSITMGEFDRVGLPFFGGCEMCGATMGPAQSHPSKTGYLRCGDCLGDLGFETVEEFEAWCKEH